MAEEKEIKLRIIDKLDISTIKARIEKTFNIFFCERKQHTDVYYDLQNSFYFNLKHGLRIRDNKHITYKALHFIPEKKPNHWFVLEKEYEMPVSKKIF